PRRTSRREGGRSDMVRLRGRATIPHSAAGVANGQWETNRPAGPGPPARRAGSSVSRRAAPAVARLLLVQLHIGLGFLLGDEQGGDLVVRELLLAVVGVDDQGGLTRRDVDQVVTEPVH